MWRENHNLVCIVLGTLVGCFLSACASSPSHPPTFTDFQRSKKLTDSDFAKDSGLEKLLAPYFAAQFTAAEIATIERRCIPSELIGAAMQAPIAEPRSIALLEAAVGKNPTNPISLAALAYKHLSLLANKSSLTSREAAQNAIDRFSNSDPENAVPIYFRASLAASSGDLALARQRLSEATQQSKFITYHIPICKCIIEAAESLNYPKYTARHISLGQIPALHIWTTLSKTVLGDASSDHNAVENCLTFGRRYESQSTLLIEEVVALSIQRKSIEKLNEPELNKESERIQSRRNFIKATSRFFESDRFNKITEHRMIEYLDDVYKIGEGKATQKLARELGDKSLL